MIYCTSCHSDDTGGSMGPHGSRFSPILRDQYETADGTRENPSVYALCYRCHSRMNILSDSSFKKNLVSNRGGHSDHIDPKTPGAKGTPCSACHDPHGIVDDGRSGSHTHLINFDTMIVSSVPPNTRPIFTDTGPNSGTCTLICHGVTHINKSYPN
jgi:hypothetical protein